MISTLLENLKSSWEKPASASDTVMLSDAGSNQVGCDRISCCG